MGEEIPKYFPDEWRKPFQELWSNLNLAEDLLTIALRTYERKNRDYSGLTHFLLGAILGILREENNRLFNYASLPAERRGRRK